MENEPPAPALAPAVDITPAPAPTELEILKAQLTATAAIVLSAVPDHLRALIPDSLAPADLISWFNKAKATGAFDKPTVPTTDLGKPSITPIHTDTAALPAFARMAAGYTRK